MKEFTRHNLIQPLGYTLGSRSLQELLSHPLVNCELPDPDYNRLQHVTRPVIYQPLICFYAGAVSVLENLQDQPITPVETAEALALYYEDRYEPASAENLFNQLPYLEHAVYRASHLRLLDDLPESTDGSDSAP